MITVRFLRAWRMYQAGETAGFDDTIAEGLVAQGFAILTGKALANAEAAQLAKDVAAKLAEAEAVRLAEEETAKVAEAEAARLAEEDAAKLAKDEKSQAKGTSAK